MSNLNEAKDNKESIPSHDFVVDKIVDEVRNILEAAIRAQAKRIADSAEDMANVTCKMYRCYFEEAFDTMKTLEGNETDMAEYHKVLDGCNQMVTAIEGSITLMVDGIIDYMDGVKDSINGTLRRKTEERKSGE